MSVYFIERDGLIKIGCSGNPQRRANELHGSLLGYTDGDFAAEKAWHQRFAADRVEGEWFRPSAALAAAISEAPEPTPPDEPLLFSVNEVAELCVVHPMTVRGWIRRGLVPAIRVGPKVVRIRREDVDAILAPVEVVK